MARLTLTLLGGFRAHLDPGAPLAFPTRKAQALLSYLAMPVGEPHSRDKLASLLWGSTVETTARTSLRQTLYSLRRILRRAESEPLRADGNLVSVDPSAVSLDVLEFERCVQEGTPQALAEAVTLYRGDLLEGLTVQEPPFEDWLRGERERLHELALGALARLLAHHRAMGSTEAAIQTALRLLTLDALQEPTHRTLMQLYVETGRYLRQMLRDVQVAGGRIEVRRFASPADIAALPERLVFNCTGLGSRDLMGDAELQPVRGQLAILEPQPEVRYAALGDFGYMFPRPDGIVLGGTFERGVWDTTPDPKAIARIVASHKRFFEGFRCTA